MSGVNETRAMAWMVDSEGGPDFVHEVLVGTAGDDMVIMKDLNEVWHALGDLAAQGRVDELPPISSAPIVLAEQYSRSQAPVASVGVSVESGSEIMMVSCYTGTPFPQWSISSDKLYLVWPGSDRALAVAKAEELLEKVYAMGFWPRRKEQV